MFKLFHYKPKAGAGSCHKIEYVNKDAAVSAFWSVVKGWSAKLELKVLSDGYALNDHGEWVMLTEMVA